MVNVVGPGVQTILAPGIALARGAGLGGAVAAAAYLALNRPAPPPRVAAGGGAAARGRGGAARVIAADGVATGAAVDDAGIGERRSPEADAETVGRAREGRASRGANATASGGPGH